MLLGYHLFLQSLNASIYGIHSRQNLLRKEGSSNLSQVIQQELHSKSNSDKLLNHGPPLQNPLSQYSIDKVMLNVVHHAPPIA